VTHAFVCRLVGSEKFRQQLLKRRGKLVLLIPPKVGIGVKEVAEYLQPILTAAAGGSLDAYRRRQSHVVHQEALDTNQASSLCLAGQSFAQQLLLLIAFSCKHWEGTEKQQATKKLYPLTSKPVLPHVSLLRLYLHGKFFYPGLPGLWNRLGLLLVHAHLLTVVPTTQGHLFGSVLMPGLVPACTDPVTSSNTEYGVLAAYTHRNLAAGFWNLRKLTHRKQ